MKNFLEKVKGNPELKKQLQNALDQAIIDTAVATGNTIEIDGKYVADEAQLGSFTIQIGRTYVACCGGK